MGVLNLETQTGSVSDNVSCEGLSPGRCEDWEEKQLRI